MCVLHLNLIGHVVELCMHCKIIIPAVLKDIMLPETIKLSGLVVGRLWLSINKINIKLRKGKGLLGQAKSIVCFTDLAGQYS